MLEYYRMTEADYQAKCDGARLKRWKDDEATMYVAFVINISNGGKPDDFTEFYPPLNYKAKDLPTDDEIDKMFEGCQ